MILNAKTIEKIRRDNEMSLKLALHLKIPQTTLFARIDRKSESFLNDMRVVQHLKDEGYSDEEIFEPETSSHV